MHSFTQQSEPGNVLPLHLLNGYAACWARSVAGCAQGVLLQQLSQRDLVVSLCVCVVGCSSRVPEGRT